MNLRTRVIYFFLAMFFRLFESIESKNILTVFSHVGKSHFVMYEPYVKSLADRGHTITLLTWFNVTKLHPNIDSISFGDENSKFEINMKEYESVSKAFWYLNELSILNRFGQKACSSALANPRIQNLIESKPKFDLVIVEYFNTDCFTVFSHLFNAPLVGIFSSPPMPWHNEPMGNPDNPSYIVNVFAGHSPQMNFFARLKNTLILTLCKTYYKMFYAGSSDKIIRSHLGKGIPKVGKIITDTSIFLVNSHYSIFQARPLVPGMIEVGGLHVETPRKLPADLEKKLSGNPDGFIYFSLGTVLDETTMPERKRRIFVNAFKNLTQTVLWKWRGDDMADKPKNVLIKKWLPQNDVLGHPNMKAFVTHGGLMGTMEAITHGIPMIIIPFFGDQFHNAALISEKGSAIVLDYFTLTENKLLQALKTVLEDKRYLENAKRLAVRFKERPLSGMNSAVYWTEYVLKFKGASHLKPANVGLNWFVESSSDVWLFVILSLVLIFLLTKKAISIFKEVKKIHDSQKKKKK